MQYYLFIDECGHHDLKNIDPDSPFFSLCGIIITQDEYQKLKIAFTDIKNKFWGSENIIFRSYDIRHQKKGFTILKDLGTKTNFYLDLNSIMTNGEYSIISPVIHKIEHVEKYGSKAQEVYQSSITFLFERCIKFLEKQKDCDLIEIRIAFEKRGKKEDEELKKHITKLLKFGSYYESASKFNKYIKRVDFIEKSKNLIGLQMADIAAYPIAIHVIYPERPNPAFEIVRAKLDNKNGVVDGCGIKRFPPKKNKSQELP